MARERKRIMMEVDKELHDFLTEIQDQRVEDRLDKAMKPVSLRRLTKAIPRMITIPTIKDVLTKSELKQEDDI